MHRDKFLTGLFGLVIAAVMLLVGYTAAGAATKEIIIGESIPLTGPAAPWFIPFRDAAQMAVDDINRSDGIVVKGEHYQLKHVVYDNTYDPGKAVDTVNKLIFHDGAKFIMVSGGACLTAAAPIYEKAGVLNVSNAFAGKKMIGPEHPLTLGIMLHADRNYGLYAYFKKTYGLKTIAIANPDDDTGNAYSEVNRSAAAKNGLQVVANEFAPRTTTDFQPVVGRIVAKNPDMIDLGVWAPANAGLMIKVLHELGYKGVVNTGNNQDPEVLLKIAGKEALEGVYDPCWSVNTPLTPRQKEFKAAFEKRYNYWESASHTGYTFVQLVAGGIQKAGSLDPRVVAETIREGDWKGMVSGDLRFSGKESYGINGWALMPSPLTRFENGIPKHVGFFTPDRF